MIEYSEQLNELAGALSKAQAEIKGAIRDSDNPFFKSRYADLSSVWEACRTALTNHGLAIIQGPSVEANVLSVCTMLLHASGQWVRSTLSTALKDQSPQVVGSATTYLRRYGLAAMAGVAPHDDDDGNAAQGNTGPAQGPQGRGARREALQEQSRRANADAGPYAHTDAGTIDKATGEVLSDWPKLQERMVKWSPEARAAIPPDEALFLMPEAEAEQNREMYIAGIREAAARRKLSPQVQTDVKAVFTGSRASQLAHVNIYILRALWIEMRLDEPAA